MYLNFFKSERLELVETDPHGNVLNGCLNPRLKCVECLLTYHKEVPFKKLIQKKIQEIILLSSFKNLS